MTPATLHETFTFLRELAANNNKAWMDANRPRYRYYRGPFEAFVEELIDAISAFDPSVAGLTAKDCTYRMNRDIRFSADKSPYKTHFSAFIAPRGKNSGLAGYYLHLEPEMEGSSMIGHSIVAAGQVCMPTHIASAEGFSLDKENALKRTPVGFDSGTPYDELLKLKDHCLARDLTDEELFRPDFKELLLALFRSTKPYLDQLNRAIQYGYEEMM